MPVEGDDTDTLEKKWMSWIEAESLRRMMAHLLIRDSQTSSSLLIPPLVSFSEFKCDLPCPKTLWEAPSATAWAAAMLSLYTTPIDQHFSVRSCLQEIPATRLCETYIDLPLGTLVIAHAFWEFCWQQRQLDAMSRWARDDRSNTTSMLSNSIKQIANQKLQQFRLMSGEWQQFSPEATLTCERVSLSNEL